MTELQWAPASGGEVPNGAVACDGQYIGRAQHDNGVIVGPVVCPEKCCAIGYCGLVFHKGDYEVLLEPTDGRRLRWDPLDQGKLPSGAVKGGYLCSGHDLYVARAWVDGKLVVGHVNAEQLVCCVPSEGKCADCRDFHVLVAY